MVGGAERVDRTDKESEKRVIDSKLHVLECEIHHSRVRRIDSKGFGTVTGESEPLAL